MTAPLTPGRAPVTDAHFPPRLQLRAALQMLNAAEERLFVALGDAPEQYSRAIDAAIKANDDTRRAVIHLLTQSEI